MKTTDNLPPQAVDLEEAVLGVCLLGDKEALEVLRLVIPDRDCFYKPSHQKVYDAIIYLNNKGDAVDLLTIVKRLGETKELDSLGGAYYVSQLANRVGSAANMEFHCRIIVQKWLHRKLINITARYYGSAFNDTEDIFHLYDGLISDSMKQIDAAVSNSRTSTVHVAEAVKESLTEYAIRAASPDKITGITSGIRALDRITNGFQKSDMIVIAARPGMGKTAFILGVAQSAAADSKAVGIISLEMPKVQLTNRMIVSHSGVNTDDFKRGKLRGDEERQMQISAGYIESLPIFIDDSPALNLSQIARIGRRLKKDKAIEMLIVDYLQLMSSEGKGKNREQQVSENSRGLKAIAKELNIPVIALSQLSRAVETRGGDKRPQLSDLRDSGAIEQDADMVIFLYRPEYHGITTFENGESTAGIAEIIISKHRNGDIDTVEARFIGSQTKFTDLHPETIPYNSQSGITPNTHFNGDNPF